MGNPDDRCAQCGWARGASIHGDSGCGDHAFVEPAAQAEVPMCYETTCRYYGQRHATAHESREVDAPPQVETREEWQARRDQRETDVRLGMLRASAPICSDPSCVYQDGNGHPVGPHGHKQPDPDAAVRALNSDESEKLLLEIATEAATEDWDTWGCPDSLEWVIGCNLVAAQKAFAAGRALGRDDGARLTGQANAALASAIHVLMRPVAIEVDAEVHEARMACMRAQDAIARRGKGPGNG